MTKDRGSIEARLLPTLPRTVARKLVGEILTQAPAELATASAYDHPQAVYPPVGGRRVSEDELSRVRAGVMEALSNTDFPRESDAAGRRRADLLIAVALADLLPLTPRVAMDREVWNFLACVVFPDVVRWRFPESGEARYLGGQRNALQRLWLRATILRDRDADDQWHLMNQLPEDALVQIFERPAVWADWTLARHTASELTAARRESSRQFNFQTLVRRTLLEIRQMMPIASLTALSEDVKRDVLRTIVAANLERMLD
tara:strand:+ start:423 stop:1199 length:777 start_codon:yes stop_codon:yes gene_type:complete